VEELLLSDIKYTSTYMLNKVRQMKIRKAEPSAFELEISIEKLKGYKSSGSDQIPAEHIQAEVKNYVLRSIDSLILFGIWKKCLSSGSSLL
jgi:hypothetical protein